MRAIKRNIEKNNHAVEGVRTHCLEFNAWSAEKTDAVLQLYRKIHRWADEKEPRSRAKVKALAKSISMLAADITLRKFGSITYKEAESYFKKMADPDTISTQIGELIGTSKLVIFIDDLDRCTASNILEMLEVIKNVLAIKNLVFVVTVDVKKIERAWELRYNSNVAKLESVEHVEKMFPIMFSLPQKDYYSIEEYLDHLVGWIGNEYNKLRQHLIKSLTGNPRRMKRTLNAIHFAIVNYDLRPVRSNTNNDCIDECQRHFAFIITWVSMILNHRRIAEILQTDPRMLIAIALFCNACPSITEARDAYRNFQKNNTAITIGDGKRRHEFHMAFFNAPITQILGIVADEDGRAFDTLKQIALFFKEHPHTEPLALQYYIGSSDDIYHRYDASCTISSSIFRELGLVGM